MALSRKSYLPCNKCSRQARAKLQFALARKESARVVSVHPVPLILKGRMPAAWTISSGK
jgi:hypothetical protein